MKKIIAVISIGIFLAACDADNTKDKVESMPEDAKQQIGDTVSSLNEPAGGAITSDTTTNRDTSSYERMKQKQ